MLPFGLCIQQLAASIITQVSPNSPNPGAKPSRPSKAQRQPKAKRKQDESTDAAAGAPAVEDGQEGDEDEAAAVGDQVDGEQPDGSEETTASSLTKSVNTAPGGPEASSAQVDSKPSPAPSALTADQSSTLKTTEATTPKPPVASASSPAAASAPRSTAANNTARPKSQKKKGGLSGFFLACLPCISSNAHDDSPANAHRPTTAASTSTPTPAAPNTTSTKEKADPILNEKTPDSTASTTKSSSLTPLSTDLPIDEKEVAVAPPSSSPSPSGVVLSQEETEGVTSGAVMAPGKEAHVGATPGKTRRRRSGKAPESIITQVPEPGAALAQDSSEEGTDESEDEDEEDEEQSLIARGGVGIPIGEVSRAEQLRAEQLRAEPELTCFRPRRMGSRIPFLTSWLPTSRDGNAWCWTWTRLWCTVRSRFVPGFHSRRVAPSLTLLLARTDGTPSRLCRAR